MIQMLHHGQFQVPCGLRNWEDTGSIVLLTVFPLPGSYRALGLNNSIWRNFGLSPLCLWYLVDRGGDSSKHPLRHRAIPTTK